MDILRRFLLVSDPFNDSVCRILYEATVHLHLVQLDSALLDVAGAFHDDFSLVGQEKERDVVDDESKFIRGDDIKYCDFPLGFAVLQYERKHSTLRSKSFAVQIV